MKVNDLTGKTFGKLKVISKAENCGSSKWLCECECGNEKVVFGTNLVNGRTQSCGCTKRVHGDATSKLYSHYMRVKRTGVTEEWNEYLPFKEWALEHGYAEGVRICRKDVTLPYGPDNTEIRI